MEPVEPVLSWVAGTFGLFRSGTCAPVTLLVFTFVRSVPDTPIVRLLTVKMRSSKKIGFGNNW